MRDSRRWPVAVAAFLILSRPCWAAAQVSQLGCDAPVTATISTSGQVDNWDLGFNVNDGEVIAVRLLRFSTTAGFFNPVFSLVDRFGQQVTDKDCKLQNGREDCGPLQASGNPYRVRVATSSAGTGTYGLQVQRLGATCSGVKLQCDTPVSADISGSLDTDVFELGFAVQESEVIAVRVAAVRATSGAFDVRWRLLDHDGVPVADTNCRFDAVGLRDCGPLPASGNPYRIEVQDPGADGIGTYKVYVARQSAATSCESGVVECDGSKTAEISNSIELDLVGFDFPVVEGEIVSINVLRLSTSGAFQPAWRLLDKRGIPVADPDCDNTESGSHDCGPLPADGDPYRVEIYDPQADGTGSYVVYAQRLTEPNACERHPVCQLEPPYEHDLLSFEAHDQIVTVNVTAGTTQTGVYSPRWRLIDGKGLPVADSDCDAENAGIRSCGPLPAFGNPYRIELAEAGADGTGLYNVTIDGVSICGTPTVCNANDPCCGADGQRFRPAGTVCRSAAGVCDVAEVCDGAHATCPSDAKSTNTCRAAQGACDVVEHCDGTHDQCPSDTKAADGTACSNGLFCDGAETCSAGSCRDNADPCATGSCDETLDRCPLPSPCTQTATMVVGKDAVGSSGEVCVPLELTNAVGVKGLEGIVTSDLEFSRIECGDRDSHFSCAANQLSDGRSVRFSILDVGGSCLPAGTGAVARMCFASDDQTCQDASTVAIGLQSVTAGDCNGTPVAPVCTQSGAIGCVEIGDCEVDRDVDLFDILHMIDLVLEVAPPEGAEQTACDTDCNGELDIFDIFRMIDVLLGIRPRPLTCSAPHAATSEARLAATSPSAVEADLPSAPNVPSQPFELRRRGKAWVVRVANDRPLRGVELTLTPTDGPVEVRGVRSAQRARGLTTEHRQADPHAPVKILMTAFDDARIAAGHGTILTIRTPAHHSDAGHLTLTDVKVVQ